MSIVETKESLSIISLLIPFVILASDLVLC